MQSGNHRQRQDDIADTISPHNEHMLDFAFFHFIRSILERSGKEHFRYIQQNRGPIPERSPEDSADRTLFFG